MKKDLLANYKGNSIKDMQAPSAKGTQIRKVIEDEVYNSY